jgi:hypothetical protein
MVEGCWAESLCKELLTAAVAVAAAATAMDTEEARVAARAEGVGAEGGAAAASTAGVAAGREVGGGGACAVLALAVALAVAALAVGRVVVAGAGAAVCNSTGGGGGREAMAAGTASREGTASLAATGSCATAAPPSLASFMARLFASRALPRPRDTTTGAADSPTSVSASAVALLRLVLVLLLFSWATTSSLARAGGTGCSAVGAPASAPCAPLSSSATGCCTWASSTATKASLRRLTAVASLPVLGQRRLMSWLPAPLPLLPLLSPLLLLLLLLLPLLLPLSHLCCSDSLLLHSEGAWVEGVASMRPALLLLLLLLAPVVGAAGVSLRAAACRCSVGVGAEEELLLAPLLPRLRGGSPLPGVAPLPSTALLWPVAEAAEVLLPVEGLKRASQSCSAMALCPLPLLPGWAVGVGLRGEGAAAESVATSTSLGEGRLEAE